jgi:hypothetical protein
MLRSRTNSGREADVVQATAGGNKAPSKWKGESARSAEATADSGAQITSQAIFREFEEFDEWGMPRDKCPFD